MKDLPCPFCGGKSESHYYYGNAPVFWHRCESCGAQSSSDSEVEGADRNWNTRHVPEGYKLAPINPTDEMADAGGREWKTENIFRIWDAMINAAPEVE